MQGNPQVIEYFKNLLRGELAARDQYFIHSRQYEDQGHPYYATARLWDDGVIDPASTRDLVGLALEACSGTDLPDVSYGVFRM